MKMQRYYILAFNEIEKRMQNFILQIDFVGLFESNQTHLHARIQHLMFCRDCQTR